MTTRTCYDLPPNMTHKTVMRGLIDAVKPCAPDVRAHFTHLIAFKPFFDANSFRINIIQEGLYNDIKDYPEIAVVLALDDMRLREGRYFKEVYEIIREVKEYAETIYNALEYFKNSSV